MQTRFLSLVEQIFNVGSGFFVALLIWIWYISPHYGFNVTMIDNLEITGLMTIVSVIRGYCWRRLFNWLSITVLTKPK